MFQADSLREDPQATHAGAPGIAASRFVSGGWPRPLLGCSLLVSRTDDHSTTGGGGKGGGSLVFFYERGEMVDELPPVGELRSDDA